MRTIVDIPSEKLILLNKLCLIHKVSRAEMVRRAIDRILVDYSGIRRENSYGIWKNKKIDSLEYEKAIRDEWS